MLFAIDETSKRLRKQTSFWIGQRGPIAEILEPVELRRQGAELFADTAACII
jgi:hypothetical protein